MIVIIRSDIFFYETNCYFFQSSELRLSKLGYDTDLEAIYRSDHDTNAQRVSTT